MTFKAVELSERVYYSGIDSPIGTIWAASTDHGLFQIDFPRSLDDFLGKVEQRINAKVVRDPERFEILKKMVDDYFDGKPVTFDLPFDLRGTSFQREVWRAIYGIPYGMLSSYGRLAANVGRPKAARAVGNAVGANPLSIVIPCHRVIRSNGSLGGFGGGLELKRLLLGIEGIVLRRRPEGSIPPEIDKKKTGEDLRRYFFK